jgi:hypothetical protein
MAHKGAEDIGEAETQRRQRQLALHSPRSQTEFGNEVKKQVRRRWFNSYCFGKPPSHGCLSSRPHPAMRLPKRGTRNPGRNAAQASGDAAVVPCFYCRFLGKKSAGVYSVWRCPGICSRRIPCAPSAAMGRTHESTLKGPCTCQSNMGLTHRRRPSCCPRRRGASAWGRSPRRRDEPQGAHANEPARQGQASRLH